MNILTIGDLVGDIGVKKLKKELKRIIEENNINFVIVNGENAAEGMGISKKNFNDLLEEPIDVITMGNHTWAKKDIFSFIDHEKLIVPANYSPKCPGKGYNIYNVNGKKICVVQVLGRTSMTVLSENPFNKMEKILERIKEKCDIIMCEVHAEATAEKIAMGHYLTGMVTCVFGTHTHVQTADECILEKGTMYISDVGMTGPIDGVIGVDKDVIIERFMTGKPSKHVCAKGRMQISAVLLDFDLNKIERIHIIGENTTN